MANPNHGGPPHPNGYGAQYGYGGQNVYGGQNGYVVQNGGGVQLGGGVQAGQGGQHGYGNGYGNGYGVQGQGVSPSHLRNLLQQQQQHRQQAQPGYDQVPQSYRNPYQQVPRHNVRSPGPYGQSFIPHRQANQQPRTQVYYGNPNIVNDPGFAAAAAGPPSYDVDDDEQERNDAYAEAEVMTSASARRVDAQLLQRKLARAQRQFQIPQPNIQLPIDLQDALGKILTHKSVYVTIGVLEHGGDINRMSNGIYKVRHPEGEERVAKFLRVNEQQRQERARAERNVLSTLSDSHSNHINFLYDSYWPNGSDNCILILQYCNGNNVEHWIKEKRRVQQMFDEGFLWHTIHHLASALSLCHHGVKNPLKKQHQPKKWSAICHLDLKPANVFVNMKRGHGLEDDEFPTIVLGDFGCAVTADDINQGKFSKIGQPFGTQAWYPPEQLPGSQSENAGRYGKSTDIWQLGAVIACMARLDLLPNRAALATNKPCGAAYSDGLNKLVSFMLHTDLNLRPTAIDIVEKMQQWGKLPEDKQKQVSRERAGL